MADQLIWRPVSPGLRDHTTDSLTSNKDNTTTTSSSSSEDDDQQEIQRLKEAAISMELYSDHRNANSHMSKQDGDSVEKISLRPNQMDIADYIELHTTEEFKTHIANKLSLILDRDLEFCKTSVISSVQQLSSKSGIKLLSTSQDFMKTELEQDVPKVKAPYLHDDSSSDNSEEDTRLAEAAISIDGIRQQDKLLSSFEPHKGETVSSSGAVSSNGAALTLEKTEVKKQKKKKVDTSKQEKVSLAGSDFLLETIPKKKKKKKKKYSNSEKG